MPKTCFDPDRQGGVMPKTCFDPHAAHPVGGVTDSAGWLRSTLSGPTMATRWSARFDADPALDLQPLRQSLAEAVAQVDRQMSPWKPDSDLVRLNRAAVDEWVPLPRQILAVLARALEIGRLSDGAFDAGTGALVDAWGFGAARSQPDAAAIRTASRSPYRPAHDWLELDHETGRACKRAPLWLDLCGIAKGYAVDQMVAVMSRYGIGHALLSLDGEVRACGAQADARPWAIGLESPQAGVRAAHGVIELADGAVATSGDYRHWVQVGDTRLSHTMDGRHGAPVRNALASVTVLGPDCMSADAWATALWVAGPGEGLALASRLGLDALFLLRRETGLVELGLGRFA